MPRTDLINYFRQTDQTGDTIGQRQAGVFQMFAALSGHGSEEIKAKAAPRAKKDVVRAQPRVIKGSEKVAKEGKLPNPDSLLNLRTRQAALTVRIEINLPANAHAGELRPHFQSIKANLLDD